MRDGNTGTTTLGRVLLVAVVLAVLVLSVGCVVVTDCGWYAERRVVGAECQWVSGPASR